MTAHYSPASGGGRLQASAVSRAYAHEREQARYEQQRMTRRKLEKFASEKEAIEAFRARVTAARGNRSGVTEHYAWGRRLGSSAAQDQGQQLGR